MIRVEPILYTSKTLKNGEHPIMIRFTYKGKRKYVSLGVSCSANHWNKKEKSPTRKHPLYKEIHILITEKVNELRKEVYSKEAEKGFKDINTISKQMVTPIARILFSDYIDELVVELKSNNKIETANIYRSTKNVWSTFLKKEQWNFHDIDLQVIKKFETHCESFGRMPNTIFLYLRTLKTMINTAKRNQMIPDSYDPFQGFNMAKYRNIKTRKRAISRENLLRIEELKIDKKSRKYHSRNYFIFSYYAAGINFVDLAQLEWDNVEGSDLVYTRRKTSELLRVPLMKGALNILHEYRSNHSSNQGNYIFPILDKNIHLTSSSISNRLNKVNHQINKDLQEIGSQLGVSIKLTTYVARHTFATVMKYQGVPTSIIGQALGHEDEKTTRIYLDSFGSDMMKEAFKKL
jgi:integrase